MRAPRVGLSMAAAVVMVAATAGVALGKDGDGDGRAERSGVVPGAPLPSVGQTWLADFGDATPFGPFAAAITFTSATQATFVVTKGGLAGATDTVQYTSTRVRPGLYVVRWHEPTSGADVTHIEDYTNRTVVSSIVVSGFSAELDGTFTKVR